VAERRASTVPVDVLVELPRKARPYEARLVFVERLEPTVQQAEDLDTQRLVSAFQAGHTEAFAELYMRYFDRVYAYLRVALNDGHDAEDATQQVFTKVFEALPRYERTRAPFRGWMFVIVRNHAISAIQKRSRTQPLPIHEIERRMAASVEDGDGELPVLDWITDREVLMFVERLPLAQRQVLMLRYMLDLTHTEVAIVLNRSEDDVRMLQSRALRYMRERLAALGRTPSRQRGRLVRCPRKSTVLRARRFALYGGL
jgi:RNA polymerase sigma-70 factor (ECF subfamily)